MDNTVLNFQRGHGGFMKTKGVIQKLSKRFDIPTVKFAKALKRCPKSLIKVPTLEKAFSEYLKYKRYARPTNGEVQALVRMIELASAEE